MSERPVRRRVRIGDATLSYLAAGPPDADEVVLLLHGIPAGAELWRDVAARLAAAGHRVLAPDLLGYGASEQPSRDHSLDASAAVIAAALDDVGVRAWVVGHDLGGGVAQILAVRHGEVVRGLTLTDAVAADNWPVTPVRLFAALARAGAYPTLCAAGLIPNPYASWMLRRGFADPGRLTAADRRRVFWDSKVGDPEGRRRFADHLRSLDPADTMAVSDRLGLLELPTQLIWAGRDRFLPWEEDGELLRGLLPDPRISLIGDAGHYLPLERPDAYAQTLLPVLA